MRGIITFALLVILPVRVIGQISKELFQALPDSVRPASAEHLSYSEIAGIVRYGATSGEGREDILTEIDGLCQGFGQKYLAHGSQEQKILHATLLTEYWIYRLAYIGHIAWPIDSAEKYNSAIRTAIGKDTVNQKSALVAHYTHKGDLLVLRNSFTDAYKAYVRGLSIAKELNSTYLIKESYLTLSFLYLGLELYKSSIVYQDSSLLIMRSKYVNLDSDRNFNNFLSNHYLNKAWDYFYIWRAEHNQKDTRDSSILYSKKLIQNLSYRVEHRFEGFRVLSKIMFREKDYLSSAILIDSAMALVPDYAGTADYQNMQLIKGLCLVHLGRRFEGKRIIRECRQLGTTDFTEYDIIEDLYQVEKEIGDAEAALFYHERLIEHKKASQALKSRSEIFEMQQKFDAHSRDSSIQNILERAKRNQSYMVVGSFGILLVFGSVGLRYRLARKRSSELASQMNELTELLISRIQSERERERQRFGGELHDELADTIGASIEYLRLAGANAKDESEMRYFRDISNALEKDFEKANGKAHELFMEELAQDFWKRLIDCIEFLATGADLKVSIEKRIPDLILTSDAKTQILLIAKEVLTNIIKHSKATRVGVVIYRDESNLFLEISDNGRGGPVGGRFATVGMKSMQDRAHMLSGKLELLSAEPIGQTVKLTIPQLNGLL